MHAETLVLMDDICSECIVVHRHIEDSNECSCIIEFIIKSSGKEIKCEACQAFYHFSSSLINSVIQEHDC